MEHEGWSTRLARWALFWNTVLALFMLFFMPLREPLDEWRAVLWLWFFTFALVGINLIFSGIRYRVQGIGFVYWFVDDAARTWRFRRVIMEETAFPWRRGRGVAVRIRGTMVQFGVCKRSDSPWQPTSIEELAEDWVPIDTKTADHEKVAREMYESVYDEHGNLRPSDERKAGLTKFLQHHAHYDRSPAEHAE